MLQLNVGLGIMIYEKIVVRRTIRRYTKESVPKDVLEKCVDAARLSPSGMNRQPLKYIIVDDEKLLEKVFGTTSWAGYLPDYEPSEEEMPRAYIIVLLDKEIRKNCGHDAGIAVMSISMVAYEEGLGSCILGAIERAKLRRVLKVPDDLEIVLAVALGYPAENPIVDRVKNGDVKYWLDNDNVLHVPKRELKDIVKWNGWRINP
jgi:nitroreductase